MLLLILSRGAQVVCLRCTRGRVSLFICAQRRTLLVAVRGPTRLLLQCQGLRTTGFLHQVATIADYLTLWVVHFWVVAFARLIHYTRLNMTSRLYVTTSWLYVAARLDVTRLDVGGDVRRPRDQRVIEVRHRGIRRLVRLLANGQELFVDSASCVLRLQLRHFAGRRLRQLGMWLRLRRH